MPAIELTPAQRKDHRAAAHHLQPVVMIGADGLTPAVVKEIDAALTAHGLIKVRVFSDDRTAREALLGQIADELNAAPIQHIGKLLVLWRPLPKKTAESATPADGRSARPRVVKILTFSKSGSQRAQIKKVTVLGNERITAGGLVKRAKKRPTGSSVKKRSQGV
ncbi:MAG TPA: YhbY family RNA-binding protein [Burkholderiaceae bacterium]|nr:YhbY family RNA-binding protein [Burkholderiaceae bacterium]HMX10524.1 YhbY family RNA-binding protein [Burkholderiaceae bacterium]HMZ01423.1 YhbY family RNA-binding protein [Burkholderiaceae bacterium]HNB46484.1 YhbY family RNA-binding protein [Burkholderiaceae bacterium]HNG81128.1 YhbY family RNA-binding protein [Burkholderiaceae bacterium]